MSEQFLTISTSHILPEDGDLLNWSASNQLISPTYGCLLVYKGCFGWFVHVDFSSFSTKDILEDGFSAALVNCLLYADKLNIQWIRFDQDADLTDELEIVNNA